MTVVLDAPKGLQLRDYQKTAVSFLQDRKSAALFLDMGLGKTAISLRALTKDHLPVLVTAPPRVARHVWPEEVSKWRPDLTIRVATGSPEDVQRLLASGADIVAISNSSLHHAEPVAASFKTFIIDELSAFKNHRAARTKVAKKITKHTENVWGLTGTPAPNGLLDLWSQMYLIDGGETLGTTYTSYQRRYFSPGRQLASGVVTEWNIRPGAAKQIHKLLEFRCLSMSTEGRVVLPPVTYNSIEVPLPSKVRGIYRTLKDDLVADVELLGGGTAVFSAVNAAVLSSRLAQVSAGFLYPDLDEREGDEFTQLHTEKIKALQEILGGTGSPVLVAYRFRAELEMLRAALPQARTLDDGPDIVKQWNAGNVPVLLVHPKSAGHGLNLQYGGHTMVWTSLPWSLEEYQQANKRLARSGQVNPVVIHHLLSPGTIDRAVLDALTGKKSVQDALLTHLESPL